MNIQDWFPLGLTGLISLQSQGLSRVFSNTQFKNISSSALSLLYGPTLTSIPDYWKNHNFNYMDLYQQSNADITLSRYVIAFLPRNKCLLMSWLLSPSAVNWEPKKIKYLTVSIVFPSICHEAIVLDAMILVFWMFTFKSAFSLSSLTYIKSLFSSCSLSAISWGVIWSYWYFCRQSWFQLVLHPVWHFTWCALHIS